MLKNHFAFIIDSSGSMSWIRNEVINALNNQLNEIRKLSKDQPATVSVYTFANKVNSPLIFNKPIETVPNFTYNQYVPNGSTALWDAVGTAVQDIDYLPDTSDPDTSVVVMPLTDGEENASKKYNVNSLKTLMGKVIATDRWTFAFLVPRTGVNTLLRFGIPQGNIQPWDANAKGVQEYDVATRSALNNFVAARAAGQKSTKSFFKVDMTGVDTKELKKKLTDISSDYLRLAVSEAMEIRKFVEQTTGKKYQKGTGFYQLLKPENVQDYKEIIIQDKTSNVLFGGEFVRGVLGMPDFGTIRVHPGNHGDYNIYIQSTSVNRKLSPGTSFLLKA